jgi:hypothetical protein
LPTVLQPIVRTDVPEPVTLVGLKEAVMPAGDMLAERLTVPEKPF